MAAWQRFNEAPPGDARSLLFACCGSTRWVERMMRRRPLVSREDLLNAAREEWFALSEDDWREAFRQHPRIGDREALRQRFAAGGHLSEREQAGLDDARKDVLAALAEGNADYEQKFGYIFIVCATGLTAEQMLDALRARLGNEPEAEIEIAAAEQAKITAIRIEYM
jgi:2-oxo-4-hydroxy-4-carboxy-5-ureidoimidazoline decarboxylase